MPAFTLHKRAQQEAPDAYISMCMSTTQETRVQKIPTSTLYGARPRRCPRRHLVHVCKDTRVHPLGVHTEMHAPRHTRIQKDTRVGLLLRAPKMAAPAWTCAKMHASPLLPAPRRCVRLGGYGAATKFSLPPFFQPRSPHEQEQREEGVWL